MKCSRFCFIKSAFVAVAIAMSAGNAMASQDEDISDILPGIEITGEAGEHELEIQGEGRAKIAKAAVKKVAKSAPKMIGTAIKFAGSTEAKLFKETVKIYAKAGWEAGRLMAPADPGPYPGFLKATGIRK